MTQPGEVVAAEFVSDGDPYRDDKDDTPRPAGVYITIRLDNNTAVAVGGTVSVEWK